MRRWKATYNSAQSWWAQHVTGQTDVQQSTALESTYMDDAADHSITDLSPTLCALCSSGDIEAVESHLQKPDTDVNETDSAGETPLHKACNFDNLDILKLLLKQDGIKISPKSGNGQTPLHIASRLGNLKAAEFLIDAERDKNEAKCNINMPDSKGLTPLCYAATIHQGREDMIKFLVERYFVVSNCTPVNEICMLQLVPFAGVLILVRPLEVQQHAVVGRQKMLKISLNCVVV